jgi:hypothetical protein
MLDAIEELLKEAGYKCESRMVFATGGVTYNSVCADVGAYTFRVEILDGMLHVGLASMSMTFDNRYVGGADFAEDAKRRKSWPLAQPDCLEQCLEYLKAFEPTNE